MKTKWGGGGGGKKNDLIQNALYMIIILVPWKLD